MEEWKGEWWKGREEKKKRRRRRRNRRGEGLEKIEEG
jgi:hypothetical protein